MDKYLIINADDFGMCRAANMAVADLFEKGGITSATIMTPCGWAKNAGIWAKNKTGMTAWLTIWQSMRHPCFLWHRSERE